MARWMMFLAALSLAACGGGGGGSPAPASVFVGPYTLVFITIEDDRDTEVAWGTGNADGQSLISVAGSENDSGIVSSQPPQSLDFTIAADGTMTLGQGGTTFLRGAVRADGAIAVLHSVDTGQPGIAILLRRSGAYSPATATGAYGYASFGVEVNVPAFVTISGASTLDGVGNAPSLATLNAEGGVSGGTTPLPLALTYTIAGDGTGTLATTEYSYSGAWSPGGDFAVFGGDVTGEPTAPGSDPIMWAFTRRGAGLDNTIFSGTYEVVGVEFDVGTSTALSFYGTATANGFGGLSLTGRQNAGGAVTDLTRTATYVVAGDGSFELNRTGLIERITGTISPDGRYAIAGGALENGSSPVFWIAFRD